jgi:hypothetical protein
MSLSLSINFINSSHHHLNSTLTLIDSPPLFSKILICLSSIDIDEERFAAGFDRGVRCAWRCARLHHSAIESKVPKYGEF